MPEVAIQAALEQAYALMQQRRLGEATLACQKIVERAPDCVEAFCALGNLWQQRANATKALKAYEEAARIDPGLPQVWIALGSLYSRSGELEKAEACYRASVELDHRNSDAVSAWCTLVPQIQRPAQSYRLLEKLLSDQHSNAELCFQVAILCSKLGRHAEALDCIDRAVANAGSTQKYILGKADILERRGDFEQTFDILKPFLEAAQPNIGAVLVFSRFSHVVGLRKECLQLLEGIRDRKTISLRARAEVTKAIEMVRDARLDW